jgi:hypothetical protein
MASFCAFPAADRGAAYVLGRKTGAREGEGAHCKQDNTTENKKKKKKI